MASLCSVLVRLLLRRIVAGTLPPAVECMLWERVFGKAKNSLILLLLFALPAAAQTEAVVSWDVRIFLSGVNPDTGMPVQVTTYLKSTSRCNQAKVPSPGDPVVNPTRIVLDDPDTLPVASRDCILGPNASGNLSALPFGFAYVAVAVANGATLTSTRSAASNPFARAQVPTAPQPVTGLRVVS